MSNLKKQLYDRETNQNISPITDTEAVFTPDGKCLEQVISGKGADADAYNYDVVNLGEFQTTTAACNKLDEIYSNTSNKYNGRLKMAVAGTTMRIDQYVVGGTNGKRMQVIYGPFSPSANGSSIVSDLSKTHICYRISPSTIWLDFSMDISLKSVNGQSLIGSGNIIIGQDGSISIDSRLDESSRNAVENSVLTEQFDNINTAISKLNNSKMLPFAGFIDTDPEVERDQVRLSENNIWYDTVKKIFIAEEDGYYYEDWVNEDGSARDEHYVDLEGFYYTVSNKLAIYYFNTDPNVNDFVTIDTGITDSGVIYYTLLDRVIHGGLALEEGKYYFDSDNMQLKKCISVDPEEFEVVVFEHAVYGIDFYNGSPNLIMPTENNGADLVSLLTSSDFGTLNNKITELNKARVIPIAYWGSDVSSQGYRNLQTGDYWYNPSDHKIWRKGSSGASTLVYPTPKVALLFKIDNASFYLYEEGENAVYDRILDTKDLQMGGTIVNKIDEKIAANEAKYLGNIYEVKWWQEEYPTNAEIGDYWYELNFSELRIITNTNPFRFTTINTPSKGSLLMRRLDGDNTYNGKVYELDSRWPEMRLLDEADLSRLNNDIAEKIDEQDLQNILKAPQGETTLRKAADRDLLDKINVLTQKVDTVDMVTPLGALVSSSTIDGHTLDFFASEHVYDLVYSTNLKKLLIRERHISSYDSEGNPITFDSTTYYSEWTVTGKPSYVEFGKASDYVFKIKEEYYLNDYPEITPLPMKGFYYVVDNGELTVYKWDMDNGDLAKTGSGEGGNVNVRVDSSNNTITIGNVTIPFKTVNSQTLLTAGNISINGGVTIPDNSKHIVYPEAFGAYGDGIDFYDWPLVCFGGIIETEVTIQSSTPNVCVPAPSERLFGDIKNIAVDESTGELIYSANNYGLSVTSANVVYSTVNHKFLLYYNNKYYGFWKNSEIWNCILGENESLSSIYPRTDVVYSDISVDTAWEGIESSAEKYNYSALETKLKTLHRKAKRVSYIFKKESGEDAYGNSYTANSLVNIERFMHNDYTSFSDWLAKADDGYSLKLTKGKIYYIEIPYAKYNGSSWSTNPLHVFGGDYYSHASTDYHGLEIDFGGAVLFVRLNNSWFPHVSYYNGSTFSEDSKYTNGQSTIFQIGGCNNITFKNLTVRALRDRDGGCVGRNARLSSSDSALVLFDFNTVNDSSVTRGNIKILNLDVTNMTRDFNAEPNNNSLKDLEIDGWKSVGVAWNGIRGGSFLIKNADVTTARYLGGCGYHIFYLKGQKNFTCIDCSFKHPDHFNEPMLSYGSPYNVSTSPVTFINCTIDVDYIGEGTNLRFVECKLIQKYFYFVSGGKEFRSLASDTSGGFITLNGNGIELYNSIVYLTCHYLGYNGNNDLVLDNVTVFTADTLTKPIFRNYQGTAVVKNFKTNYSGTIGIDTTDYDASQRAIINEDVTILNNSMYGINPSTLPQTEPSYNNMVVGDMWYDTPNQVVKRCTVEGTPTKVTFGIIWSDSSWNGGTYSGYLELRIPYDDDTFETIRIPKTGTFSNIAKGSTTESINAFKAFIEGAMQDNGYAKSGGRDSFTSPGQYYLEYSSSNSYLHVYSKRKGAAKSSGFNKETMVIETNVTHTGEPVYNSFVYSTATGNRWYNGTDPTITIVSTVGVETKVEELEQSQGFALQPSFGTSAPTGVPVGTYWYDTNQTSNVDNGLKIYNGSTWEAVDTGKARIIFDSTANSGAGALYLCLNGKKYKTFTLS